MLSRASAPASETIAAIPEVQMVASLPAPITIVRCITQFMADMDVSIDIDPHENLARAEAYREAITAQELVTATSLDMPATVPPQPRTTRSANGRSMGHLRGEPRLTYSLVTRKHKGPPA